MKSKNVKQTSVDTSFKPGDEILEELVTARREEVTRCRSPRQIDSRIWRAKGKNGSQN